MNERLDIDPVAASVFMTYVGACCSSDCFYLLAANGLIRNSSNLFSSLYSTPCLAAHYAC